MEDEYYTVNGFIAHKSCKYDGKYFSNAKYASTIGGINYLKQKCDLIDKINENIDIPIWSALVKEIVNFPHIVLCTSFCIKLYYERGPLYKYIDFSSYENFYDYMYKNYTHLIKNYDIKIALKN